MVQTDFNFAELYRQSVKLKNAVCQHEEPKARTSTITATAVQLTQTDSMPRPRSQLVQTESQTFVVAACQTQLEMTDFDQHFAFSNRQLRSGVKPNSAMPVSITAPARQNIAIQCEDVRPGHPTKTETSSVSTQCDDSLPLPVKTDENMNTCTSKTDVKTTYAQCSGRYFNKTINVRTTACQSDLQQNTSSTATQHYDNEDDSNFLSPAPNFAFSRYFQQVPCNRKLAGLLRAERATQTPVGYVSWDRVDDADLLFQRQSRDTLVCKQSEIQLNAKLPTNSNNDVDFCELITTKSPVLGDSYTKSIFRAKPTVLLSPYPDVSSDVMQKLDEFTQQQDNRRGRPNAHAPRIRFSPFISEAPIKPTEESSFSTKTPRNAEKVPGARCCRLKDEGLSQHLSEMENVLYGQLIKFDAFDIKQDRKK